MNEPIDIPTWREAIIDLPKPHLHLHLEGSLSDSWVARQGVPPFPPLASGDFTTFIDRYREVTDLVSYGEEPLRSAFVDVLRNERDLGSRWVEITVDPFLHSPRLGDPLSVLELMAEALSNAAGRLRVDAGLIVAIDRTCGVDQAELSLEAAHRVAAISPAVVAVGIANDERQGPLRDYVSVLAESRLPVVPHAGELLGSDEVVFAAEVLGARRIGHGTAAVSDDAVEVLTRTGAGVEACITSNELLEVVDAESHPLRRWLDAGVAVSLHADDPGLMGTDIANEYVRAQKLFDLSVAEVATLARNGWNTSCAPEVTRTTMLAGVAAWEGRWRRILE